MVGTSNQSVPEMAIDHIPNKNAHVIELDDGKFYRKGNPYI